MMSSRTRGTSAKKKMAKMPATAPKPAAVVPLFASSVLSLPVLVRSFSVHPSILQLCQLTDPETSRLNCERAGVNVLLSSLREADAVEVRRGGVPNVVSSRTWRGVGLCTHLGPKGDL